MWTTQFYQKSYLLVSFFTDLNLLNWGDKSFVFTVDCTVVCVNKRSNIKEIVHCPVLKYNLSHVSSRALIPWTVLQQVPARVAWRGMGVRDPYIGLYRETLPERNIVFTLVEQRGAESNPINVWMSYSGTMRCTSKNRKFDQLPQPLSPQWLEFVEL